jgi:hypothetical protein
LAINQEKEKINSGFGDLDPELIVLSDLKSPRLISRHGRHRVIFLALF